MERKYLIGLTIIGIVIGFLLSYTQLMNKEKIRYVAIGDSYTIGEGAAEKESWPQVLTDHLNEAGLAIELVANPSVTGWTTQQVIENELPIYDDSRPDFATLLIGVNDYVQGVGADRFEKNLVFILDRMQVKLDKKQNLVLVTIPDFAVTRTGNQFGDPLKNSKGIAQFNQIIVQEAKKRDLKVVDIFDLSQDMGKDESLVSSDGLHPSAKEYALWEEKIFPVVYELLKK